MDHHVVLYLAYLVISVSLTIWVATILSRNGMVFLRDVVGDLHLARSVNRLLVCGLYLLSLGFMAVSMNSGAQVASVSRIMEVLSVKLGWVMLILGALHLLNVLVLIRYRRNRQQPQGPAGWPEPLPGPYAPYPPPQATSMSSPRIP